MDFIIDENVPASDSSILTEAKKTVIIGPGMKDNPKNLLTSREKLAIEEYKDFLLNRFPSRIEKILLFGSKARGEATRDSDVDLIIV